jgi:hypothetical protein
VPKENIGGHKYKGGREVETVAARWLTHDTNFYEQRTDKLSPRYAKCFHFGEDYVENYRNNSLIKPLVFKINNPKYMLRKLAI